MDDQLRRVERRALAGDAEAERLWRRLCGRIGLFFRDHQPNEILSEWEEIQDDYDEDWWHRRKALRWGWDWDVRSSLVKAHHIWGHRWGGENSKRKTLRTHRSSKKKARNYRPRNKARGTVERDKPHERRRKKRFGGREHRYGRDWSQNQRTGRWRIVYKFGVPDLDG